eukprot:m.12749 g.12749  ORF g.12749 m.12749 type:complete len:747 (+) comp4352_c0_seq1:826-3066(+)
MFNLSARDKLLGNGSSSGEAKRQPVEETPLTDDSSERQHLLTPGGTPIGRKSRRRRRDVRSGYVVNNPLDQLGDATKEVTYNQKRRLQAAEDRERQNRIRMSRERPLSTWENFSVDERQLDPLPAQSHAPTTEAARRLAQSDDEEEDLSSPLHAMQALERRAQLVRGTEFQLRDKKRLLRDERGLVNAVRRELTCGQRFVLFFVTIYRGIKAVGRGLAGVHLWQHRFHRIEGHFGTAVVSYFVLLRTLVKMNFFMALLLSGLVVIPQGIIGTEESDSFKAENLVLGNGYFGSSLMFMGSYTGEFLGTYDTQLAYFLTVVCLLIFCMFVIVTNMADRYDNSRAMSGQAAWSPYSVAVLASWDMAVSNNTAVQRRQVGVARNLKELLAEDETPKVLTNNQKWVLRVKRVFLNLVICAVLGGAIFSVDYLARRYAKVDDSVESLYAAMALAVYNALLPSFFATLADYEEWSTPRINLRLTLARAGVLRVAGVYVVVITLFRERKSDDPDCWETAIGQEIYRLLMTDTLVHVFVTISYDATRWFFFRFGDGCCSPLLWLLGTPQFNISQSVLSLIYRQALVWLGMLYSPLLPFAGCVCNVVVMFVKDVTLRAFLQPPTRVFRAATSDNFYAAMLLVTLFVCIGPAAYSMVEKKPSANCGPFREYSSMYEVIPDKIKSFPTGVRDILFFLGTASFILPLLLVLIILLYYFYRLSRSMAGLARHYKLDLEKEIFDKRDLIKAYRRQSAGSAF